MNARKPEWGCSGRRADRRALATWTHRCFRLFWLVRLLLRCNITDQTHIHMRSCKWVKSPVWTEHRCAGPLMRAATGSCFWLSRPATGLLTFLDPCGLSIDLLKTVSASGRPVRGHAFVFFPLVTPITLWQGYCKLQFNNDHNHHFQPT